MQPSSGPPPSVDQDEEADQVDVSAFPNGLRVCYIDDSKAALRTLEVGLPRHLGAAEVKTFGHNGPDDVPRFMEHAPQADIIMFDHHIDFPGAHTSGLELLRTIKAGGFQGLLIMRSGNTSDQDCLQYREAGCHCILDKAVPTAQAGDVIKKAYLRRERSRAPPDQAQSSCSTANTSVVPFSNLLGENEV